MECDTLEKLLYLLNYLECCIETLVNHVLSDSEEDPHFSAVSAANLIKCYICVQNELGYKLSYRNVEEYLQHNCFTMDEIGVFEEKRNRESTYFQGKQY